MARTMNSELAEGMSDGKYKKVRMDTSNAYTANTALLVADRSTLNQNVNGGYGFSYGTILTGVPSSNRVLPDGTTR